MQRDESNDGRRSLGSCCPEDLSVWSRLLRESDPRTRGPQSPALSDTTVIITSVQGGAREPQSGFPDGAGDGAAAGGVVQFLDKVVDVPVVFLGSLSVGAVQFLDKAVDVPVVVPQLLFLVVDDPVVQVIAWVRPVLGQGG